MVTDDLSDIEELLGALGSLLAADGLDFAIVVLGGAALNLLGLVARTTKDVDVLAIVEGSQDDPQLVPPDPLPDLLQRAANRVARDFSLPDDWINGTAGLQLKAGLPPGLVDRLQWQRYGGLTVGLVDRYDLIFFKLYAAADDTGPWSVHYQDLVALNPTAGELASAEEWVRKQDVSEAFHQALGQVMEHIEENAR